MAGKREALARALWLRQQPDAAQARIAFRDASPDQREELYADVDALLQELREPDEGMLEAGYETEDPEGNPPLFSVVPQIWKAVIDYVIGQK